MGAGRIVYQELTRITKEIEDGDFFQNEALKKAMENAKAKDSALHLFGLVIRWWCAQPHYPFIWIARDGKARGLEQGLCPWIYGRP